MRRLGLLCGIAVLVACEKPKEQPAADTTAAAEPAPAPAAPAPISLADVAGKWTMRTMPEDADTTLLTFELDAKADTSGWIFNFPKRKPVPVHVTTSGDSIITEAGPYESVLRKGVQVKTNSVMWLKDGKLVGNTVAHYASGADTVRRLRTEGTRKP
ncbi:MAG TPA: hypothetical protein VIG08_01965 [Gemmatimonadales bacterium]|jgi:hypothetical protein